MARGNTTSFYLSDGLGSTRLLTDATGVVTDSYDYDTYGNLTASSGWTSNPYRFTGEQFEPSTGLYGLRARNYDPLAGRFLGRDPFSGTLGDPVSRHPYLYAHADPVNRIDPSGLLDMSLAGIMTALGAEDVTRGIKFGKTGLTFCRAAGALDQFVEVLFIGAVVAVVPNVVDAIEDAVHGADRFTPQPTFGFAPRLRGKPRSTRRAGSSAATVGGSVSSQ